MTATALDDVQLVTPAEAASVLACHHGSSDGSSTPGALKPVVEEARARA